MTLEHALYAAGGYLAGTIAYAVWAVIRFMRHGDLERKIQIKSATKEAALLRHDLGKIKDLQYALASARRLLTAAALTNHGLRISDCAVEAVGNDDYVLTFERPIGSHDVILTARRKDA